MEVLVDGKKGVGDVGVEKPRASSSLARSLIWACAKASTEGATIHLMAHSDKASNTPAVSSAMRLTRARRIEIAPSQARQRHLASPAVANESQTITQVLVLMVLKCLKFSRAE